MRIRLLPCLMFALAGTMTIKVGAVWNAFEVSIGRESLAQGQSEAQPEGQPEAAAQPAVTTDASSPQQQAATTPPAAQDIGVEEPMPEETAALPEGAVIIDEEAGLVEDPFEYTDEEVDVLQQLAKRREELDLRARQLDEREALIAAAEQRMEQKMAELKALQAMVEDLLKARSEQEEAELASLVKMYENMKPKAAARVFEEMDMDVLLDVVERMNERKAAPILALVTPTKAKEITFELAQRRQLPVPE